MKTRLVRLLPWLLCALCGSAWAQQPAPGLPLVIAQGAGGTSYSVPIQTLLFFTALSFLPAVLLLMTGFTRIVIVLSLLRQALGTQAAPPNQVIVGLSLFLTFFVMSPTLDQVYEKAYQPFAENRIAFDEALKRGEAPMREFMLRPKARVKPGEYSVSSKSWTRLRGPFGCASVRRWQWRCVRVTAWRLMGSA
jgi:flagellar biosynthetic protein FliP